MQISAATPACVAMTVTTLDHLTNGRLILGVGVSGPQVVEGWYGQPFPRPDGRTREFVTLLRQMLRARGRSRSTAGTTSSRSAAGATSGSRSS
jgi:alkanesulfonate monooxygenase SsuD/methylene tetrahydromethanopterin reductase-like flavin-dependent oxidoreductase (luciferase family)